MCCAHPSYLLPLRSVTAGDAPASYFLT